MASDTHLEKLQKIQNKCVKALEGTPVEITGLATGWGVAGARDGWLGTG